MILNRIIPPSYYVYIFVTAILLLGLFSLHQVTHQPWLGIHFTTSGGQSEGLLVSTVNQQGPAFGLVHPGERVLSIRGKHDEQELTAMALSLPIVFPTHQALNEYLSEQERIYTILQEEQIQFILDDARRVTIRPQDTIPISQIPYMYLGYLLAAGISLTIGFLVWRYRPHLFVTRLIFIGSIGILLFYISVLLFYKELALPANLIYWLVNIETSGVNLYLWTSLSVSMIYPLRIYKNRYIYLLFTFFLFASLLNIFQIANLPFHTTFAPFFIAGLLFYYLYVTQWRASLNYPAERAVLQLFLLVMVIPTLLMFVLQVIPQIFYNKEIVPLEIARFVFIPIMAAWALAVIRYRLFDVSLWWFRSIFWVGGALLVFVLDLMFIYLLNLTPTSALSAALLLAGFIYFPLRQLLLGKFLSQNPESLEYAITTLRDASSDSQFQKAWYQIIQDRFQPVKIKTNNDKSDAVQLRDEGLVLAIPDVVSAHTHLVYGKKQGNSLFNQNDVRSSVSLLSLAQAVLQASKAREEAIKGERTRIMRDLHDSLGAKLLSMVHRYRGQGQMQDASEALQLLRDTVHLSVATGPQDLNDLLAEWRADTNERLQINNIRLHWQVNELNRPELLASEPALLLCSLLRESINNALKHSHASNIYVTIERISGQLHIRISNDGVTEVPERWKLGFGITHLRDRLERLGGKLSLGTKSDKGQQLTEIHAVLPDQAET